MLSEAWPSGLRQRFVSLRDISRRETKPEALAIMYYVYCLISEKNQDLYIGSCENIDTRVTRHNRGYVKSTKANRPWRLVRQESFATRSEAVKREMFLKTGQQKELLKKELGIKK